jgi:hypothetical protein
MRGFSRIELGKLNPPGRGHVPYKVRVFSFEKE